MRQPRWFQWDLNELSFTLLHCVVLCLYCSVLVIIRKKSTQGFICENPNHSFLNSPSIPSQRDTKRQRWLQSSKIGDSYKTELQCVLYWMFKAEWIFSLKATLELTNPILHLELSLVKSWEYSPPINYLRDLERLRNSFRSCRQMAALARQSWRYFSLSRRNIVYKEHVSAQRNRLRELNFHQAAKMALDTITLH